MWKQFLSKLSPKPSKSTGASASSPRSPGDHDASKRNASAVFPSAAAVGGSGSGSGSAASKPLPSFQDVPTSDAPELFLKKLDLCCAVFDFTDPNKSFEDQDLKRHTLIELVEYVDSVTTRFSEPTIAVSCRMFAINLFRVFPPNRRAHPSGSSGGEVQEDEPMFDPAWMHLQLVYDLLLKFIASSALDAKIAKKYVDHCFISRLLELFESEDPRERDCVKTVLHRLYGKFMTHRHFIRKAVSNIFFRFVFETERHNGIAELLEVFGSVISGFVQPLKEEHKVFLWKALIPLHKPKSAGLYLQQLTYCIMQYIEKEPNLASTVIMGVLKYWPTTSSQKEVMFLSELEEILEATVMVEFQKCMVPLFRRIGCCLNSSHFQVAERALFLWNNDRLISLTAQNRQAILPLVFPALERNARHHWNKSVLNATLNVRKMLSEMDEQLFLACQCKFGEEEEERATREERRRMIWETLETSVAFHPVMGINAVHVPTVAVPLIAATST